MPLGKVQQQILVKLVEMSRLSPEQAEAILATPGELTGDALDKLLQSEYRITDFQLLVSRARAHGLAPTTCSVSRWARARSSAFRRTFAGRTSSSRGVVGEYLLVALANPFEVRWRSRSTR